MQKRLPGAFAAAIILSVAMSSISAMAMPLAAPSTLGAVRADATITPVAVICGTNGCGPVRVSRIKRPPKGFITKAAPLVFPMPNAPQTAANASPTATANK